MEGKLRTCWAKVLDRTEDDVRDDSNFFDIGGDSVHAIKLSGVANANDVPLHAQTIFENPTFSGMLKAVSETNDKADQSTSRTNNGSTGLDLSQAWDIISVCLSQCDISHHVVEDILPCTPFQAELMRSCVEVGSWMFHAVFEVGPGSLDRAKQTIDIVRKRTPAFRVRICQHESGLYQVVVKDNIEWVEITEPLEVYKARDISRRPGYGDPHCRYAVVRNGEVTYLVITQMHTTYDRWAKTSFVEDVHQCFQDPEKFSSLPPRPPFRKFVDHLSTLDRQAALQHWAKQLDDLEKQDFLFAEKNDRPPYITSRTDTVTKSINFEVPKLKKVSFDAIVNVAWALTLANISQQSDVFFATTRSCRHMSLERVGDIIGPLWSLVPVRHRLDAKKKARELLGEFYDHTIASIQHEPFGIEGIHQHFGNKNLQSLLLPQPPQPESFSATSTAQGEDGSVLSLRAANELWTQTRGNIGLYIMLTPTSGNKLNLWARYDDRFLSSEKVEDVLSKYANTIQKLSDAQSLDELTIGDICPHLSSSEENEGSSDLETDDSKPKTLTHLIRNKASKSPAVIIPSEKPLIISHYQLQDIVGQLQHDFAKLGVKQGSAVSIALPNSLELIVAFLAATWQRGIAAPLNPGYKQDEFEFYIDDLGSAVVVIPKGAYEEDGPAVKAARKYNAAIAECYWDGKTIALDVKEKGKLESEGEQDVLQAEEDDIGLVLHTSGTTGRPKAVPLTNVNLVTSIENICRTYELKPKDRTMLIMPLFHVHGLLASFLSPLYSGGSAIIPPRLEPSFWKTFLEHKANWYTATPSMHRLILQFPPPDPIPEIRFIRSCSSQLAPALFEKLEQAFKAPVLESYAMTEASHLMCSNPLPPGKHFPGTVGQPQGVELRILDQEGKEVEQGGEGEVSIRGANVTKGYLNNEEANQSSFTEDGFFRTGDQGKVDKDGYLTLTGRLKEMVNKGGEKISPVELDNVISQHEDIAEACTFAIDDEAYGQDIGCAVKLADGKELSEQELKKWVGERLSAFKVPKKVWFPADGIPKTATGKLQRKMVAEKMMKG